MELDVAPESLRPLLIMAGVVEARDPYTVGHQWRLAEMARALGAQVGLDEGHQFLLALGGHLHDIGMMGIPDGVLKKPKGLSKEEFDTVRTHPVVGADILENHPLGPAILDIVRHHHERVDGNGYPDGLSGEKLGVLPKIIAIVDSFDALTSARPYREAMPIARAGAALESGRNTQFDGELLDGFFALAKSGRLNQIVAHSDEGCPLLACDQAGPVIRVPRRAHDGQQVVCRASGWRYELHRSGNTFTAHSIEPVEGALEMRPRADLDVIDALLADAPRTVAV